MEARNITNSDVPTQVELREINSEESLIKFRMAEYNRKYNLSQRLTGIQFIKAMYAELGLSIEKNDFFEYCIFNAANCLASAKELSLNLRFDHNRSTVAVHYGINDNLFLVNNPGKYYFSNHAFQINEEDTLVQQLKKFNEALECKAKELISMDAKSIESFKEFNNLQYRIEIPTQAGMQAFICNPLLTADFMIKQADNISDKAFVSQFCRKLQLEINAFRDLPNGPDKVCIDNLSKGLKAVCKKHSVLSQSMFNQEKENQMNTNSPSVEKERSLAI